MTSTKYGICMEGNEVKFQSALAAAIDPLKPFHYLEIGCNVGGTVKGVVSCLKDMPSLKWKVTALDTQDYSESFHFMRNVKFIKGDVHDLPRGTWFDFVFIDGCHGKPCVIRDFTAIEDAVPEKGFVCFHDASPQCQGGCLQEHCGTGIAVREALQELGLLDETRQGWKKWGETNATHGIFVIQKL